MNFGDTILVKTVKKDPHLPQYIGLVGKKDIMMGAADRDHAGVGTPLLEQVIHVLLYLRPGGGALTALQQLGGRNVGDRFGFEWNVIRTGVLR